MSKVFVMILLALSLQACVYATYNATAGEEALRVISVFKEVDGFSADRDKDKFNIVIDKTRANDPFAGLSDLLEAWNQLQAMGINYTPVEVPYRADTTH